MLKSINYSAARNNLKALLDEVEADAAAVVITRTGAPPAVLMPASMYTALVETEYLLADPKNAKVLRKSIANVKTGRGLKPMKLRRD
ncbi:MAG: type II toxin-antitoxin system prevent-host-death family antitoxin [Casimicrobiaceae bacterium]